METKIQWNEGDGAITATYNGSGDGAVTITSDINEGIDREQTITAKTIDESVAVDISVKQSGMREVFCCADGEFNLANGGTFNVLKNELRQ